MSKFAWPPPGRYDLQHVVMMNRGALRRDRKPESAWSGQDRVEKIKREAGRGPLRPLDLMTPTTKVGWGSKKV